MSDRRNKNSRAYMYKYLEQQLDISLVCLLSNYEAYESGACCAQCAPYLRPPGSMLPRVFSISFRFCQPLNKLNFSILHSWIFDLTQCSIKTTCFLRKLDKNNLYFHFCDVATLRWRRNDRIQLVITVFCITFTLSSDAVKSVFNQLTVRVRRIRLTTLF